MKIPSFIDSHAHLIMLKHDPLETILDRAARVGIRTMITVSTDDKSWEPSIELASQNPQIFFTLGVHPHEAQHWNHWEKKLLGWLNEQGPAPLKCVGIGETGLDFHYNFSSRESQIHALKSQIELSKKKDLPLILHCREAFDDLFEILKKEGLNTRGGVMHCFTGGEQEARLALDLGLKISFSGILSFRNAEKLRQAARMTPLSEILIETDCPFLAPLPHRGKPNEPSFLPRTAECLAQTLGKRLEEIADVTSQNAIEFFKLVAVGKL